MSAALEPIPAANEWQMIQAQADTLSRSNIVPKAYRGKPADIVAAALFGREVGIGPMLSLTYIDVIEGSPALNAEGKVALVRRAGHSISGQVDPQKAVVKGRRADSGDEMTVTYTVEHAKAAGLLGKDNWKKHLEDMLWSRAVSQLCRRLFGDVTMGLYTPEEVESFAGAPAGVDATTGEVIDVQAIEAPKLADIDLLESINADVANMDDEFKAVLRGAWKNAGLPKPMDLNASQAAEAVELIEQVKNQAAEVYDQRRRAAFAELSKIGLSGKGMDDARHAFVEDVAKVPGGSTRALTAEQLDAIVKEVAKETDESSKPFTDADALPLEAS